MPLDAFLCICTNGWTGPSCLIDVDECASNPCDNGGICRHSDQGVAPMLSPCEMVDGMADGGCGGNVCVPSVPHDAYLCSCRPGFTGVNCETDFDECGSVPCKHGARCIDSSHCALSHDNCSLVGMLAIDCGYSCAPRPSANQFVCLCPGGWAGVTCDLDVDECASVPCLNGALCLTSGTQDFNSTNHSTVPVGSFECVCAAGI